MKHRVQLHLKEMFAANESPKMPSEISDEQTDILNKFIEFCKQHLKITDLPEIHYSVDRNDAPMTTGVFIPDQNVIFVYIKGRAFCDWIRTLAHELTHYKQHVEDRIPPNVEGRDLELEAEANIAAGDIVYNFAHSDPAHEAIYEI